MYTDGYTDTDFIVSWSGLRKHLAMKR